MSEEQKRHIAETIAQNIRWMAQAIHDGDESFAAHLEKSIAESLMELLAHPRG